jgi:hypothetical protein
VRKGSGVVTPFTGKISIYLHIKYDIILSLIHNHLFFSIWACSGDLPVMGVDANAPLDNYRHVAPDSRKNATIFTDSARLKLLSTLLFFLTIWKNYRKAV